MFCVFLRCCFLFGQWCNTPPFPSRRVNCSSGSSLRILKKPAPVHTWGSGQKQLQTWKELLNSKCRALKHNSRPRWQLTNILHSVKAYQKPPNNTRGWLHVNKELSNISFCYLLPCGVICYTSYVACSVSLSFFTDAKGYVVLYQLECSGAHSLLRELVWENKQD